MMPLGRSAFPPILVAALIASGCSAPDNVDVDPGGVGVMDRGEGGEGGGAGGAVAGGTVAGADPGGAAGEGAGGGVGGQAGPGDREGGDEGGPGSENGDEAGAGFDDGGDGADGEGEGEEGDEGHPPDRPPQEVSMLCGSAPSRVIQPAPVRLTATVVLPEDICQAHLQPFVSDNDARKIRILALETVNAEPCAGQRGATTVELLMPLNGPENLGDWTFEFIGVGPTIYRKTVTIEAEDGGGEIPDPEPGCERARVGFPGECGEELRCAEPSPGSPVGYICGEDGLCVEADEAGAIAGRYDVVVDAAEILAGCRVAVPEEVPVEQCREDPAELPPGQDFYDNLLDISGPTTLVLEQDPEGVGDNSAARLSFEGDTFLSRWSGDDAIVGTVLGNTFLGPDTRVTEAGDCARIYYLQVPRLTLYGDRLFGRIGVIHLEVNCGRGCLACELAGPI